MISSAKMCEATSWAHYQHVISSASMLTWKSLSGEIGSLE